MKKDLELLPLQIITDNVAKYKDADCKVSLLASPESLDSFKVNVIDLDFKLLWKYDGSNFSKINDYKKLNNLKAMITKSKKTKFVFCYPSNLQFDRYHNKKHYYTDLKDIPNSLAEILNKELGCMMIPLIYENNKTTVKEKTLSSTFFFDYQGGDQKLKSDMSEHPVLFGVLNNYYTTLHFENSSELMSVLEEIGFVETEEAAPLWFDGVEFFNDVQLKQKREEKERQMKELDQAIRDIDLELLMNRRFKSILYTNGKELEHTVQEILEQVMDCRLSDFQDLKKEDFLIKKEDVSFIGEIKGVNTNVKNSFISQLDNHADERADNHPEEHLKRLLIINDQRDQDPATREPVAEEQIEKAKRSKCLIIRTPDLLKVYEMFKMGELTANQIYECFSENSGLFKTEMFLENKKRMEEADDK